MFPLRSSACALTPATAIRNHVGNDQRGGEEDQAEEEVEGSCVPCGLATRAGQKAISTQTMKKMIDPTHQPLEAMTISELLLLEVSGVAAEPRNSEPTLSYECHQLTRYR